MYMLRVLVPYAEPEAGTSLDTAVVTSKQWRTVDGFVAELTRFISSARSGDLFRYLCSMEKRRESRKIIAHIVNRNPITSESVPSV